MRYNCFFFRIVSLFLVVVFLFCFTGSSVFADDANAEDAKHSLEVQKADDLFEEGKQYLAGDGVTQDVAKGIGMILAAAEVGSAKAMVEVGVMYSSGLGKLLSSDYKEGDEVELAFSWYEKAAEAGEPELAASSMTADAFSYFLGTEDGHIQEDDAVALKYFQKAAEYGDPRAINMMVAFYIYGFGVDQDTDKALEYCSGLAARGDKEALYAMEDYAYAFYAGTKDGVDINFSTAFQYYMKLTEYGNERAMYNVGLLYEYGLGVTADHEKALEWLTKAKDAGYGPAEKMLSQLTNENK